MSFIKIYLSKFNVFQYQISNRMNHFYDNFEKLQKLKFQWEAKIEIWHVSTEKSNFFKKKYLTTIHLK